MAESLEQGGGFWLCFSVASTERDDISLLVEELLQLSVKRSMVMFLGKPTLLCTVWSGKSYNPYSFWAQLKSIWKTKSMFETKVAGPNLFMVIFDEEDDLESIMAGRPWFFRRQLIVFYILIETIERKKVKQLTSPFWIKLGLCPPKFDRKDFMHAIGSSFGGIL